MAKIKIAVVGIGNCFSALYQGLEYYKKFWCSDYGICVNIKSDKLCCISSSITNN
jgi:myo-inositol-1-phosphate synthase